MSVLEELRKEYPKTVHDIVELIVKKYDNKEQGHISVKFVIGILQDTINTLEGYALSKPAEDYVE